MKSVFLIFFVCIFIFSCKSKNNNDRFVKTTKKNQRAKREDFSQFYNKFTTDRVFQLSRINFPLKGFTNDFDDTKYIMQIKTPLTVYDSLKVNAYWKKDNWQMHYRLTDTSFKLVRIFKDSLIIERIFLPNSEFDIKSVFKRIKGRWYLDYYLDSGFD